MDLRDKLLYVGREGPFPDLGNLLVEEAGLGDGDGDLYGQHIVDVFVGDLVTGGYEALSAGFIVQPRLREFFLITCFEHRGDIVYDSSSRW